MLHEWRRKTDSAIPRISARNRLTRQHPSCPLAKMQMNRFGVSRFATTIVRFIAGVVVLLAVPCWAVSFKDTRWAAEHGDAEAQFYLGWIYAKGQGVARDDAEAVKWYRKAAEHGLTGAQFSLGLMYAKGKAWRATTPRRRNGIEKQPSTDRRRHNLVSA